MFDLGIRPEWDYKNVMDFAEEKAEKKGKQEVALEMKLANFPFEQISKFTKLTITEIETL